MKEGHDPKLNFNFIKPTNTSFVNGGNPTSDKPIMHVTLCHTVLYFITQVKPCVADIINKTSPQGKPTVF